MSKRATQLKDTTSMKAPLTKPPASITPMAKDAAVITGYLAPGALSLDVGQEAVRQFKQTDELGNELKEKTKLLANGRNVTNTMLIQAFLKAAENDPAIDLSLAIGTDKKKKEALREKLEVAVGIKKVIPAKEKGLPPVIDWSDWAYNVFPQNEEYKAATAGGKRDEELYAVWRAKENFRSNFAKTFSAVIRSAHGARLKQMRVSKDPDTGKLMLSGPAVLERYGATEVHLDGQKVAEIMKPDGTAESVPLKKIPSFTDLERIGAESIGEIIAKDKVKAGERAGVKLTALQVMQAAQSMITSLTLLDDDKMSQDVIDKLQELITAIEDKLDANTTNEGE